MRNIENPTVESTREVTHQDSPITSSLRRDPEHSLNGSTAIIDDLLLDEMIEELVDGTHESLRTTVAYDYGTDRFEPPY